MRSINRNTGWRWKPKVMIVIIIFMTIGVTEYKVMAAGMREYPGHLEYLAAPAKVSL